MIKRVQELSWDSNFFDCKVGKIDLENFNEREVHEAILNNDFTLTYLTLSKLIDDEVIGSTFLKYTLVDRKTTFVKTVNPDAKWYTAVSIYKAKHATNHLIQLAIQSGVYSRFKIDNKISTIKFEKLYELWIKKLLKRENNEVILICKVENEIAGFLAVGIKNDRVDLIMGAVGEKHRGQGIGKELFMSAEHFALKKGFKRIQIVTQGNNVPACKLYEKIGYEIEGLAYIYHVWNNENEKILTNEI